MKAVANVLQVVEISERDMGEALKKSLLKKHKSVFGFLSNRRQFFTIDNQGVELLTWNDDWIQTNPDDAVLAQAANILLQR